MSEVIRGNKAVVGVFGYLDDAISAVHVAKNSNLDFRVYSPFPNHHLEDATSDGTRSPVRFITGAGAITGCIAGFALAILCSMDYPLRTSAKEIVSIPAFIVIGYECTILFGAIFTLLALFHFTKIPDIFRKPGYDPRFSNDKFGVVIGCDSRQVDEVKAALIEVGAEEVEVTDGL